jgi:hypothetical protein
MVERSTSLREKQVRYLDEAQSDSNVNPAATAKTTRQAHEKGTR